MRATHAYYSSCMVYVHSEFLSLTFVMYRLEVFESVLQRSLADNPNLVYNIVRSHKTFEDLGTFTLARGLREIRRVQLAKEELARTAVDKGKSRKSSLDSLSEAAPGDDKARLLRSESQNSIDVHSPGSPISPVDDIEAQRNSRSEDQNTGRPLMSPTIAEATMAEAQQQRMSEKARGKMRAGRSLSEDMTASLERLAASGVGRNGFVPTQEWVSLREVRCSRRNLLTPWFFDRSLHGSKGTHAFSHNYEPSADYCVSFCAGCRLTL